MPNDEMGTKRQNLSFRQRERLLEKSAGVCCVCKQPGLGVNFHHIDGDSSNTVDGNLAVLCVRHHDEHHRPSRYVRLNHLELGSFEIGKRKHSWESFVRDARTDPPKVFALISAFGAFESIHAVKVAFQRSTGELEFERVYTSVEGPMDMVLEHLVKEITFISPKIPLSIVDKPLALEYCDCDGHPSMVPTVDSNYALRLIDPDWAKLSCYGISLHANHPSLSYCLIFKKKTISEGWLHLCNDDLHFQSDSHESRTPLHSTLSLRSQVVAVINRDLRCWSPATVVLGKATGDTIRRLSGERLTRKNLPKWWDSFENEKHQKHRI